MILLLKVLSVLVAIALSDICLAQQSVLPTDKFNGRWVVTDIVGYADVSGGMTEAQGLIGKQIIISSDSINFENEHCKSKNVFTVIEVNTYQVFDKYYGVSSSDTGLPVKAWMLDSNSCPLVFLMDKHRIVFGWDGVIVRAIRKD